ncbi:hypothetical protein LZ198_09120 [Myxococcus sp. K15C18031901]|uniref:hypothetical protein n=1 Tax=Myxococcus dinghuensis TaxID=2906761 RepID=UPI0020A74138|nr:hypothetical protein [Myxococcus dinghuensis]MCP3099033.1 hypothetical protein [Myxococcus dinghuensis]
MAVLLSYRVVSREADTQSDVRRQKEAFFAAEAGLAEGREALRLRRGLGDSTYTATLAALSGAAAADVGLAGANPPWLEVLPGTGAGGWNYLSLTPGAMPASEKAAADNDPYVEYPLQNNVRYRVFVRDDNDDALGNAQDSNNQVWVIAIGEVVNPKGRPTRAVIQALVTNQSAATANGPGCASRGCGPDNTFNNTQDTESPDTTVVRTIP